MLLFSGFGRRRSISHLFTYSGKNVIYAEKYTNLTCASVSI